MEIEVRNPATGALSGRVTVSTDEEIKFLASRARSAQKKWAEMAIRKRARLLIRFHDLLLSRESKVLDVIQSETGKSRKDAFGELSTLVGTARYYAYRGPAHVGERRFRGAIPWVTGSRVLWKPYPLVGFISPWNYPLLLGLGDILPALVAGSSALLKPSERTPLSAQLGRELLIEAGRDPDLIGLVHGDGQQASTLIHEVDYVAFTGGNRTGQIVRNAAAKRMIGCSLELGGKNPMIVLEGARVDEAARGLASAASTNSGQACIGIERVFVASSLYEQFLEKAAARMAEVKVGWSGEWDFDIGSLIGTDHLERILALIEDAVGRGATVVTGGRARPDLGPAFIEPTLLAEVPEDALISREEVLGPVVSVERVDSTEEAIARANDSPYGLNASVWGPKARALEVARRLETGSVGIHSTLQIYGSFDAPMGGTKLSGFGRRHGREGIQRFAQPQSIVTGPSFLGGYDSLVGNLQTPMAFNLVRRSLRLWRRLPFFR